MKKRMMTASLAVLIGLVSMTSCKKQQSQMVATPHKTMTVETQSRELTTNYSATIRGRQDIEIYPQVGGTLQKLCVTEGQRVKKGCPAVMNFTENPSQGDTLSISGTGRRSVRFPFLP